MRRAVFITLGCLVFMAAAYPLELRYMRIEMSSYSAKLLFLTLLNLNVLAIFALTYFLGRGLLELFMERRQKVVGHRFKARVVALFAAFISVPAMLLFLAAGSLGTNFIERLFTAQYRKPLENSVGIAKALYERERERALRYARGVKGGREAESEYRVSYIESLPEDAGEAIKEAFAGHESTEVVSSGGEDAVKAYVPSGRGGVWMVESFVPENITKEVESVEAAFEDYVKLESLKIPIKFNYLLILAFFALNILFVSLWVSMRIAKGITEPFQALLRATREVAHGNLDVSVRTQSTDERRLLIESFNHMVNELKEGKESLEGAYHESDRRRLCMENILQNIQSGVISLDSAGTVLTINPSAAEILGVKEENITGRPYEEILSTVESGELKGLIKSVNIRTSKAVERVVRASIGGRKVVLRVFITVLRTETGPMGFLVVFDDVTDVIKAQRALAWQEVARRMAHEIKNPLTPIRLSTERMMKKWAEEDPDFGPIFDRSAKTIIREVESLRRLVDEFSRFGKMPEIKKEPADLRALAGEVVSLYQEFKGVEISVESPEGLPPVEIDREQMKRALINIFDNAVQAMEKGGNVGVRLDVDRKSGRAFIEVADDGPGIREEDKEKLFFPYFSTKKDGTGLGLAIAQKIVSEHNGYINVRDNEPRGSVFTIEIPVKEN